MSSSARFTLRGRNPDVLSCIANLSNDEVFTPPEFANRMLDTLAEGWAASHNGADIWADPTVTFLDPCTKSGVFLREITQRLIDGLATHIPDLEARVEHILTKQVYGIAITQITSLLARRSLYCSKLAKGSHSIAKTFASDAGNIWFERLQHTWDVDKCRYCGAGKSVFNRAEGLESHAYAFIHADNIKNHIGNMFGGKMQFDVIIGNPPYQLNDGGGSGSSASPLYNKFIEQAKQLEPRFLSMVIPSKWFSGGKGLDDFRTTMLSDKRIRIVHDFPNSREAFNSVDIAGGVMFFLWNRDSLGSCEVTTHFGSQELTVQRDLDEHEVFVRDNRVLEIIRKIGLKTKESFSTLVSARRPFDIDSAHESDKNGDLYLYTSSGDGKIKSEYVKKGRENIQKWKVLLSKTSSEHAGQTDKAGTKRVLSRIEIMKPGSVCTESYLMIGPFTDQFEATNAASYLRTKFLRFLVSSILLTQNITRSSFVFVPKHAFDKTVTDTELYALYELTETEIEFIEKTIKPMTTTVSEKSNE
jgi:hypothetical protein